MTKFLWIEDFPKDGDPRATVDSVFGALLGDGVANGLPEIPRLIPKALERYGIRLQLSLSSALRFIKDPVALASIDFIVLDIDLKVFDDIDTEFEHYGDLIRTWYGYEGADPDSPDFDEGSHRKACQELQRKAGYHLWAILVIELGFPKNRILFCSDHGDNLDSIKDAFRGAMLGAPDTPHKSDPRVRLALEEMLNDHYVALRRAVTEACEQIQTVVGTEIPFTFNRLPVAGAMRLDEEDARYFLANLANILPFRVADEPTKRRYMRQLVVAVAHLWERIDITTMKSNMHTARKDGVQSPWTRAHFAYCSTLKFLRNYTSHSANTLSELTEREASFIFLINLRAMFELGNLPIESERELLRLIGGSGYEHVDVDVPAVLASMRDRADDLRYFDNGGGVNSAGDFIPLLMKLQRDRDPRIEDPSLRWITQFFWHNTHLSPKDFTDGQSDNPSKFIFVRDEKNDAFLGGIVKALSAAGLYK